MSLPNYTKKTKPALWTQFAKPLKRSATLRNQRKAAFSGVGRGKVAAKPPKRLKSRSSAMMAKMKEYRAAKGRFLLANRHCACCGISSCNMELHHQRGRISTLLTDERFWLPLCPACHRWVHEHINEARERGLIAAPGEWNNPR